MSLETPNSSQKEKSFRILSNILNFLNQALAEESQLKGNKHSKKIMRFLSLNQSKSDLLSGFALLSNEQNIYFELNHSEIFYTDIESYIRENLDNALRQTDYVLIEVCDHEISDSLLVGEILVRERDSQKKLKLGFRISSTKTQLVDLDNA
ncbi:hypothetical protein [Synechococcus sp. PCC 7336]|uniref:hypothetical protein n=1 Tax=Synechococcus sp. PCC 7336 TaxID=195250 RepID=UPI000380DAAB|nr:hypothetical protein [Synechococcus sp. PCC 7336]